MFSVKSQWKNWAGTVVNQPKSILYPKTTDEITSILSNCRAKGSKLRLVGTGHSFSPLAATGDVLLSLKHLTGVTNIDHKRMRVTVLAGTTLKNLGEILYENGLSMENLGDINAQTVAGAISTGTHGTGVEFGSLSTQVTAVTILTTAGELMTVSDKNNSAYFDAIRVSLGMLGVIIKVELKVEKAHPFVAESYRTTLTSCLNDLNYLRESNRHFEFYWFPYTDKVQVKLLNKASLDINYRPKSNYFKQLIVENGLFWGLSELCRIQPKLSKWISNISAFAVPTGKEIGQSHVLYTTPRLVKFSEMEYSIPIEHLPLVIREMQAVIEREKFSVHFPIECRFVKKDTIWLSPSFQRDSAYIAVHMYKGMECKSYFNAMEEIFLHYQGRPHWGKMHTMSSSQLKEVYPKMKEFIKIRDELDPNQMLMNTYLSSLFPN